MRVLKTFLIVLTALFLTRCGDDKSNPVTPPPVVTMTPTITSVSPNTVSRGQKNALVSIQGTNLSGVTGITMGSDITVHGYRLISAIQIDAAFSVSTTAVAGPRTISVNTPNGTATSSSVFSVSASLAPVAIINVKPAQGTQYSEFTFDGSKSYDTDGSIREYAWGFNDGKPAASGKIVTRTFDPGVYQVTLTVTDNEGSSSAQTREVNVEGVTETVCTKGVYNHGLIYGTVIAVEPGNNAILKLDNGESKCSRSFYKCGDMRDAEIDLGFFGVVTEMADRGNGVVRVQNSCPYNWPPRIGKKVFLFYKTCEENHC